MNRFKNVAYLVGITAVLFIFVFSLTSCSLSETTGDGLTNSIGSGDGPGSGKWKPPTPQNENQCQQANNVLTNLKDGTEGVGKNIMAIRQRCVNQAGQFLPDANVKTCRTQYDEKVTELNNHLKDFQMGSTTYIGACNNQSIGMLGPKAPDVPNLDFMIPQIRYSLPTLGWYGCITCTFNLDLDYMYAPFQSELN